MSQLTRGIFWRKGQAITLFLLGTVVVAGCLVAARFSELTDTAAGSVGIILVLGVVALSVQAAASARSRRSEIALAQIRGRQGFRLFSYFLTEPITILLLAAVAGVFLGRLITELAADRWLDASSQDAARIGGLGWASVALAVAASIGAVVAGSWRTVREPLVEQIDAGHRPRPAATLVLFGQTLVIVAAGVAAFQASQKAGSKDGWAGLVNPALLSPILLGLAAGQLAAWGIQAAASLATRRTGDPRGIGRYLAVRRLARRSDSVFGTRLVIAAAVVAVVTASATTAVNAWQDESTRLNLGGPRQFKVDEGAQAAYSASHAADPDGTWLMAMVGAPDGSEPYRRMFADTARWDAVVGDFLQGTGAAGVSDQIEALQGTGDPVRQLTGDTASATFTNASLLDTYHAAVTITYTRRDGSVQLVSLKPKRPSPDDAEGSTTVTKPLTGCEDGCTLSKLTVEGTLFRQYFGDGEQVPGPPPFIVVTDVSFAGEQVLEDQVWTPVDPESAGKTNQDGSTLNVQVNRRGDPIDLEPAGLEQDLAAVTTPGLELGSSGDGHVAYGVDGGKHPVDEVGTVDALPLIGRSGALLDLPRALGRGSTIATAQSYVVARADTPQSVLDDLDATGVVGDQEQFGPSLDRAQRQPDVQGVRLYTLMSLFAALIALVGLASSVVGQRDERQREAASLRVTGVRARHIKSAHRREALWLGACAFVAVAVTGWGAARLTVGSLSLVPETAYSPTLDGDPQWSTVLPVAVAAALAVGVITLFANRRVARTSRPSMLRDDAR
jgi:ABC-type lipoprotein release transport system permease subunit